MTISLKRLDKLSGKKATVYSVQLDDGTDLFDQFLNENSAEYEKDVKNILQRIRSISRKAGAQKHFFKTKEGKPGDGVCALYDTPDKHLRLYCIRMGNTVIILGGGGPKPKKIRALQEDSKLKHENYLLRDVSKELTDKMRNGEIRFSDDELELLGDIISYE